MEFIWHLLLVHQTLLIAAAAACKDCLPRVILHTPAAKHATLMLAYAYHLVLTTHDMESWGRHQTARSLLCAAAHVNIASEQLGAASKHNLHH